MAVMPRCETVMPNISVVRRIYSPLPGHGNAVRDFARNWAWFNDEEIAQSSATSLAILGEGPSIVRTRSILIDPEIDASVWMIVANISNPYYRRGAPIQARLFRDNQLIDEDMIYPDSMHQTGPYIIPGNYYLELACFESLYCNGMGAVREGAAIGWW